MSSTVQFEGWSKEYCTSSHDPEKVLSAAEDAPDGGADGGSVVGSEAAGVAVADGEDLSGSAVSEGWEAVGPPHEQRATARPRTTAGKTDWT
ncbi:hypothetical protein GCM10017708_12870 [Arthrobacter citreus]